MALQCPHQRKAVQMHHVWQTMCAETHSQCVPRVYVAATLLTMPRMASAVSHNILAKCFFIMCLVSFIVMRML